MKTKLTLTVNEHTVKKAKNYVENTSESLSSVVEEFLESLYTKKTKPSVVNASKGLLKKKYSSKSYKDVRKEYYKEKHGV